MGSFIIIEGCHGRDCIVVGFTTTCVISAYHLSCKFISCSWWGVLDTTLCDQVCQWLSSGTPISSTNKTDSHNIIEILLKVAFNTINQTLYYYWNKFLWIDRKRDVHWHLTSLVQYLIITSFVTFTFCGALKFSLIVATKTIETDTQ
jgi:hypothetical protein